MIIPTSSSSLWLIVNLFLFWCVSHGNAEKFTLGYLTGSSRRPWDKEYSRPGLSISGSSYSSFFTITSCIYWKLLYRYRTFVINLNTLVIRKSEGCQRSFGLTNPVDYFFFSANVGFVWKKCIELSWHMDKYRVLHHVYILQLTSIPAGIRPSLISWNIAQS